jgi:hypothetical protein
MRREEPEGERPRRRVLHDFGWMRAMPELQTLEALYAIQESRSRGAIASDAWASHEAVQDRLMLNNREAESRGWTSCAIEGSSSARRIEAWGLPPGQVQRHLIPDWMTR